MAPNPYGLYDDGVRLRTLWALREGLIIGGILLFWVAIAVALTIVVFLIRIPFILFRPPDPAVVNIVWTLVAPLAFLNASLYVLVRAGTVFGDHYRSGDGLTFEPAAGTTETDEGRRRTPGPTGRTNLRETRSFPGTKPPDNQASLRSP